MKAVVLLLICSMLYSPLSGVAISHAVGDTTAPVISNVKIASTTDNSITVTWITNESADSLVNYGLKEDYGIVRTPGAERTQHSIVLDSLDAPGVRTIP